MSKAKARNIPEGFLKVIEQISVDRFAEQCSQPVEVSAWTDPGIPVLGYWMAIIMMANPEIRVTIKVFYSSEELLPIVKDTFALDGVSYAKRVHIIADFMKEYCNLIGGATKAILGAQGILVGLSLPLVTRGFDEIFQPQSAIETLVHTWDLKCLDAKVTLQVQTNLLESQILNKLSEISAADPLAIADGNLEFF